MNILKKNKVIILSLFLCITTVAASIFGYFLYKKRKDYFTFGYFYHWKDNERLSSAEKEGKRVIFIGNSITEFWKDYRPDFFDENGYINRGIQGNTTAQMLLRFRRDVIDLDPDVVVINGGINDIAENIGTYYPEFTFDNIKSMAELAKFNNIDVILSSVIPSDRIHWNRTILDVSGRVDSLNVMIKNYACANDITYIDYNSLMRDENGGLKPEYGEDRLHPNVEGYKVMERVAKPIIDNILNK